MIKYGFKKTIDLSLKETENKLNEELKKEGFGILTRINLKDKFKEKLGINFKNYIIFGVCNPPLAHKSLSVEEDIGLMLPCNIVIYEKHEKTVLSVIKPTNAMGMIKNPDLFKLAEDAEIKLKHVFENIT